MTDAHRKHLRLLIAGGAIEAQYYARVQGYSAEEAIPEIIAALLSLASHTAKYNASLSPNDFLTAANVAVNESWAVN